MSLNESLRNSKIFEWKLNKIVVDLECLVYIDLTCIIIRQRQKFSNLGYILLILQNAFSSSLQTLPVGRLTQFQVTEKHPFSYHLVKLRSGC